MHQYHSYCPLDWIAPLWTKWYLLCLWRILCLGMWLTYWPLEWVLLLSHLYLLQSGAWMLLNSPSLFPSPLPPLSPSFSLPPSLSLSPSLPPLSLFLFSWILWQLWFLGRGGYLSSWEDASRSQLKWLQRFLCQVIESSCCGKERDKDSWARYNACICVLSTFTYYFFKLGRSCM